MSMKRSGGKFSGSRTAITETAAIAADIAVGQSEVNKVCLGVIVGANVRQKKVRFKEIKGGLEVAVYGDSLQRLYVYTTNPATTKRAIESAF